MLEIMKFKFFLITLQKNKHKLIDVNSLMHAQRALVFCRSHTEYLMATLTIHVFLLQTGSHLCPRSTSPNKPLSVRQRGKGSHLEALCI